MFGAQVATQGEPTRLSVWHAPAVNQDPVARSSLSQDGRTVTVDAGASTDPDGNTRRQRGQGWPGCANEVQHWRRLRAQRHPDRISHLRPRRILSNTPVNAVEPTSTAGAGTLGYDAATQTYNYVWKTEDSWAGTCRSFDLVLNDGSSHQAMFRFVR
jgi:hypothetical protein